MGSFPCLVRFVPGLARFVTGWWTGIWSLSRAGAVNTLRAVAFDLKAFFTVIGKDPVKITARVRVEFLADQRGGRTVVRLADLAALRPASPSTPGPAPAKAR